MWYTFGRESGEQVVARKWKKELKEINNDQNGTKQYDLWWNRKLGQVMPQWRQRLLLVHSTDGLQQQHLLESINVH